MSVDNSDQLRVILIFDRAAAEQSTIWVSDTVLVELVWTLSRAYSRERVDIVKALRALLSNATVALQSSAAEREASLAFEHGRADFADCLLCVKAVLAGCDQVVTFDRGMKGLPGVALR